MRPHPDALKPVGIRFPTRIQAITVACKLWHDFGLDVEIHDTTVTYDTVRPIAPALMGMLERATGTPGFNAWDRQ
jgi:hypothetical protein